jgi:hypothetical protein
MQLSAIAEAESKQADMESKGEMLGSAQCPGAAILSSESVSVPFDLDQVT